MKFANTRRDSSVVRGSCDPVWPEDETHDFVVYHLDQKLSVEVLDYDHISKDDHLGCTEPMSIEELRPWCEGGMQLYDSAVLLASGSVYEKGEGRGELKL